VQLLQEYYGKIPPAELAKRIGKSQAAVTHKAGALGLRRKKEARWSTAELDLLEEQWGRWTPAAIARKLGRTEAGVILKAKRLGLGPAKERPGYMTALGLARAL